VGLVEEAAAVCSALLASFGVAGRLRGPLALCRRCVQPFVGRQLRQQAPSK
jgi:hypothetical protein